MRTLKESLLDDEDILLDKTDLMKNFPKRGKVGHSDWDLNRVWYYMWKDNEVLSPHTYGDSILYVTWTEFEGSYILELLSSNKNFFNANPIASDTILSVKTNDEKVARKQAYELLFNIACNFSILDYIRNQRGKGYGLENTLDIEILKKEFKDSWRKVI